MIRIMLRVMPHEHGLILKIAPYGADTIASFSSVTWWAGTTAYTGVSAMPSQCLNNIVFASPGFPDLLAAMRLIHVFTWRRIRDYRRTRKPAGPTGSPSLEGTVRERNASVIAK
jgi:hypothetical protein